MDQTISVGTLLDTLRERRAAWEGLIARAGEDRLTEPGAAGEWSLKDVIAHLTVYERWLVDRFGERERGEPYSRSAANGLEVDERNEVYYRKDRDRSVEDVLGESRRVFDALLQAVGRLSDEELRDPTALGLAEDTTTYDLIAGDSYEHYDEHIPDVEAWLARHDL